MRPKKLVFVFSRPEFNPRTQWLIRLYTEALRRMAIQFEFLDVPGNRATALSSAGAVDGELGRTYEFGALYPTLVRVEEPNNDVLFSAYATRPLPQVHDWDDVRRSQLLISYRAGIKEIESKLEDPAYRARVTAVREIGSGLGMLQRGRADLFLDVQEAVEDYLACPQSRKALDPRPWPQLVCVLQRTTGHAYLYQRNRALEPELSAILKQLKDDGTSARYLKEALSRWPRC